MPRYSYLCKNCRKRFDFFMSIAEQEADKKPLCPNCQKSNVVQTIGEVKLLSGSTKKTDLPPFSSSSCPGCRY